MMTSVFRTRKELARKAARKVAGRASGSAVTSGGKRMKSTRYSGQSKQCAGTAYTKAAFT